MKILLAHKFHKYTGGADVFYLEVGRVLMEHGHDVAYFSTIDEDTLETQFKKYFVKAPDFKSKNPLKKLSEFTKIPYNFEAKRKFQELINDFNPDLIHAFGVITQISASIFDVARKNGIPLVVSLNDYKHLCPNYKLFHHGKLCEDCKGNKFYKAIQNKCLHDSYGYSIAGAVELYVHHVLNIYRKNINLFLFASDFMAHKTEEFWGPDSFKWDKLLNPFKISTRPHEKEEGDYGLYFGRIIEEKGVHLIIDALEKTPGIPFKIIGDGPQLEELKEKVTLKNLKNVEFLGPLWGDQLDDILYKARFVIVPSVWHENFPYVILQSFAARVPVIGSNLGGIPELLSENRGITFNVENVESLSNCIMKMNGDSELRELCRLNASNYLSANFNDEVFYESLMKNYTNVLK